MRARGDRSRSRRSTSRARPRLSRSSAHGRAVVGCARGASVAGCESVERLDECGGAELGERVVQIARRVVRRPIGRRRSSSIGPGVETRVDLHDGDAGFGVAREDGALDRRGAAPARQQRAVDVQAAEPRQIEHRLRQDQPVGDDHEQIRAPIARARRAPSGVFSVGGCAIGRPCSAAQLV